MKKIRILAHIHLFYQDMWPELKKSISNIYLVNTEISLFVTMSSKNNLLEKEILNNFQNVRIIYSDNIGYDIAPFISCINDIDLAKFDFIVKMHSKRSLKLRDRFFENNGYSLILSQWRKELLYPFSSKKIFKKHLNKLKEDGVGIVCANSLIVSDGRHSKKTYNTSLEYVNNSGSNKINKFSFVAGTMFIAKSNLFHKIKDLNIQIKDFNSTNNRRDQFAHIMERAFGGFIYEQKQRIESVDKYCLMKILHYKIINFFLGLLIKLTILKPYRIFKNLFRAISKLMKIK